MNRKYDVITRGKMYVARGGGGRAGTRERVTVTLRPDVIAWLDSLVESGRFRSRSHAVEETLAKAKEREQR